MGLAVLSLLLTLHSCRGGVLDVVDDADMRIQYTGSWVTLTALDRGQYWSGTVTYSNTSGALATFSFTGDAVKVLGALTPEGSFNMLSRYTLDDNVPVEFAPPSDVTTPAFKRQFYASGPIAMGLHVLTIENLGEQFWLDSIEIDAPSIGQTSAQGAGQMSGVTATSTQDSPVTGYETAADAPTTPTASPTTQTLSPSGDPLPQHTQSSVAGSAGRAGSSPPPASSMDPLKSTQTPQASSSSSPAHSTSEVAGGGEQLSAGHAMMSSGAIAGLAIAGVVLLFSLFLGGLCWRRRKRRSVDGGITLFGRRRHSGTAGLGGPWDQTSGAPLEQSIPQHGQPEMRVYESYVYAAGPPPPRDMASWGALQQDAGNGSAMSEKRPWASILDSSQRPCPSAVPLLQSTVPQSDFTGSNAGQVVGSFADESSGGLVGPRRAVDGGFRLAGGPPGAEGTDFDSAFSDSATLPPYYQVHHG
ncbi:hypothetical protein OH77DRAFT_803612 [Trametes cingulata]|nr:hypothetical protein OH77DRAFT_803612 [Trametes cingulata]